LRLKQKTRVNGFFHLALLLRATPSRPAALMTPRVIRFITCAITVSSTVILGRVWATVRVCPTVTWRAMLTSYSKFGSSATPVNINVIAFVGKKLIERLAHLISIAYMVTDSAIIRIPSPVEK